MGAAMFPCSRGHGPLRKDQHTEPFGRLGNDFILTMLLPIISNILAGIGVAVGESIVVVALVNVLSQSYLFVSKRKVCTLPNMSVDNV